MQYIGPDYDESYGIILPGLTVTLHPRLMSDGDILELLEIFPHLNPYFSAGTNTVTVTVVPTVGGDKHLQHIQPTPATVWTIVHNLSKYPSVTIVDSGGTVVVGEVTYLSVNILEVSFAAAFAGKAYCN